MPRFPLVYTLLTIAAICATPLFAHAKVPLPERKLDKKAGAPKPTSPTLKGDLSPLNKMSLSKTEKTAIESAIKSLYKNRISDAKIFAAKIKNPSAQKLVAWYTLRNTKIDQPRAELQNFLDKNPAWPSQSILKAKIERQFYSDEIPAAKTKQYFDNHKPGTQSGKIAYAEALLKQNRKAKAVKLIREAYQNPNLHSGIVKRILSKHEQHIRKEDHYIRADRLLYLFKRNKVPAALTTAKKLSKDDQAGMAFRASVIRRSYGDAKKRLAKLSSKVKNQPGVYLARVQLLRKTKNPKDAARLLSGTKFKPSQVNDKDQWWKERMVNIRDAIKKDDYQAAYDIASRHENPSVNHYNEAEFLSGWYALRFLNNPKQAEVHFKKFQLAADGPRTGSKSSYWLARTQIELKKEKEAAANYKKSATYFNTYYGQLSAQEFNKAKKPLVIPKPPVISKELAADFVRRDEVKAITIAHLAGQTYFVRLFFSHLRYHYKTPEELALLAELAASLGYNQSTVRIGKTAMSKDLSMASYAYPVRFMPGYKPLRSAPEKAMIYSIARQESEFNEAIVSHAGARGLMQVMPATMRYLARKYKVKRSLSWLTKKPSYNVQLGSAYLADRQDEFGGSYIMTFAGFNAGPGRVRQWVKQFGDPRSKKVDPIDWVERIPFKETRNYVQKVLANVQVYRARLADKGTAMIKSHQDLHRGKF